MTIIAKNLTRGSFCSVTGGPEYTFLKPSEVEELIADLVLLHTRLVELGMEYRNGEVYLADLEVQDV